MSEGKKIYKSPEFEDGNISVIEADKIMKKDQ